MARRTDMLSATSARRTVTDGDTKTRLKLHCQNCDRIVVKKKGATSGRLKKSHMASNSPHRWILDSRTLYNGRFCLRINCYMCVVPDGDRS